MPMVNQQGNIFSTIVSLRAETMSLTCLTFGFPILALITLQAAAVEAMKTDPVLGGAGPVSPQGIYTWWFPSAGGGCSPTWVCLGSVHLS